MKARRQLVVVLLALLAASPARADWLDATARMLGLTKTPNAQRGSGNTLPGGDVMVVPLAGGEPRAFTSGGGYRSPIIMPDGTVLALKGKDLMRIPGAGGAPVRVRALPGALKLIGVDRENPDRIAFLARGGDGGALAVLSIASGAVAEQPHDPKSNADRRLMNHLRGESREYEGVLLYLHPESRETVGGAVEWTEVYAKRGNAPAARLSRCDGVPCVQPSLSPDGKQVAYILTAR
jgi:hypothetical protein